MNKWLRSMLAVVAISVPVLGASGLAFAGPKGGKAKAAQVQADVKFSRWLLSPHGDIRGLLLEDGRVVFVHPDAVRDTSLKAGDALKIDAKGKGNAIFRAKVTKGTTVVVDDAAHAKGKKGKKGEKKKGEKKKGEKKGDDKLSSMTATGTVASLLAGPKGKVHALILSDGTVAYAGHHGDLGALGIKKGDAVTVSGKGGSYALGRAMKIHEVKLPSGDVKKI